MTSFQSILRNLIAYTITATCIGSALPQNAFAEPPIDVAKRTEILGKPETVEVYPATINLNSKRAFTQVVVTGKYAGGLVRDLTPFSYLSIEQPDIAKIDGASIVMAIKNGSTKLKVTTGATTTLVPVNVTMTEKPDPVSFRREVIAAMNVGGCNAGACHGTPSGKNGFKLSLRGFDPAADYLQLTRDVLGRRTSPEDADASLMLQKGLGRVPHEGGQRYHPQAETTRVIRTWLAEGLKDDAPTLGVLKSIDVYPGARIFRAPAAWQQLSVKANFADGSSRDVTPLTVFTSSDTSIADVNNRGLVEFKQPGEIAILVRYLEELVSVRFTYLDNRVQYAWKSLVPNNFIDNNIFSKLELLGIPPSENCSDQEFLRRAYLDSCGILPTAKETLDFLESKDAQKRSKLVEALTLRPEFSDFWTLKWSDILRSNRKTIQVKGVHSFQHWVKENIEQNVGIDRMIRDLITSTGSASNNPAANYYRISRDPLTLAETTAQLFLGFRMQCAKCHNHPFERWTQDDYYSFAAFFARVKVKKDNIDVGPDPKVAAGEVVYEDRAGEVTQPRSGKVMAPKFPGGAIATSENGKTRREALADWLTKPENPFFAKSVVNRIWFHLMGKGIVDPVDDFRESNPSANDELLVALAQDFAKSGYDFRHLVRTIMNSKTYQLSAQPTKDNQEDGKYFSHASTRLLTAEQLLDSICAITEVPEKFAGLPLGTRATQLPDTEVNHLFLKTFGQPARELACECERESDSNLAQALQLINGPTINEKIRNASNRIGRLIKEAKSDKLILDDLYLATLSRMPTAEDYKVANDHLA
ncbi:MAG: DUF1553 domain-containing protein, partial [Planctomycetes bacterium]|nr:DUF1553 domain-containing protein [Planctomycetota bacterium]